MSLGLGFAGKKKKSKKSTKSKPKIQPIMGAEDDDDGGDASEEKAEIPADLLWDPTAPAAASTREESNSHKDEEEPPRKRSRRWDAGNDKSDTTETQGTNMDDALDKFMDQLSASAQDQVTALDVDVGGSMQRTTKKKKDVVAGSSGNVITAAELERLQGGKKKRKMTDAEESDGGAAAGGQPLFTHSDWESDAPSGGRGQDESASEVRYNFTVFADTMLMTWLILCFALCTCIPLTADLIASFSHI